MRAILSNRPVDVGGIVTPELRQSAIDAARVPEQPSGLPPEQLDLPLNEAAPPLREELTGPQPALQTPEQIRETLNAPEHQDVIRGDIDRAIDANAAEGKSEIMVPGIDENGNHTMISVNDAVDQVDAYKKLATDIQACATMSEAA